VPKRRILLAGGAWVGRTVAWRPGISTHRLPPEFVARDGCGRLGRQTLSWLAGAEAAR